MNNYTIEPKDSRLYDISKSLISWYFNEYLDQELMSTKLAKQWNSIETPILFDINDSRLEIKEILLGLPTHVTLLNNGNIIDEYKVSL